MSIGSSIGSDGERIAREYLLKKGYRIAESNLRIGGSEIDIIVEKDDFLVFVEVKSRSSIDSGQPEEFVDDRKISKMISGAKLFSARKKYREKYLRFDIISVLFSGGEFTVDHLENAFEENP